MLSALDTAVARERTEPSVVARNKKRRFVNVFACEMLPKCRVNVQIALKLSNLSIFFLKFPRFSKILFDVSKFDQNSRIM